MNVTWVRLRSWHIVDGTETRCGRSIKPEAERVDEIPLDEKSCEVCLRLHEHDVETAVV